LIFEGSCETEDWSNGCRKFSFDITGINCSLKDRKQLFEIVKNYCNID